MRTGDSLGSEDLLEATGPAFDAFSYHSYGATSRRCATLGPSSQVTADEALSEEYLSRASRIQAFYAALRDRYEPGKPIWLTETADAACGGNPWASTFLDSFRYLDQLGRLAAKGIHVHMHNTLAASDYGLLDRDTFEPRPNDWAALLWRRLMGAALYGLGLALYATPSTDAALSSLPDAQAGSGSGIYKWRRPSAPRSASLFQPPSSRH